MGKENQEKAILQSPDVGIIRQKKLKKAFVLVSVCTTVSKRPVKNNLEDKKFILAEGSEV